MKIRSPFFYVGDKYKLADQLKKIFPTKIEVLVEPFCGGGSVFLNTKANKYYANDINEYVIRLHKFLKSYKNKRIKFFDEFETLIKKYGFSASYLGISVPNELKKKHVKTYYAVYNKNSYLKAKNDFNNDKTNLMLLYLLLIYGFNHMLRFNSNGDFNLPVGNVDYNKNVKKALEDYFDFIDQEKIHFSNLDYKKYIKTLKYDKDFFFYFDPPYLISESEYNKMWSSKNEEELLSLIDELNKQGIRFALSNVLFHKGRENKILIEWAKKYNIHYLKANYISYHDNSIKNSVEVLITNY